MTSLRQYRTPLLIGAVTLVIALILWVVLISTQTSKLSSLNTQETQLQAQESGLQTKLASLKTEQQRVPTSCADLQKIAVQIPSVETPTDLDAEESSFESQFNGLAASTGVSLSQFSGFAPASATTGSATATPTSAASTANPQKVVAVPTTLTVVGNYGQMLSFVNGLDTFPRLFVIQKFVLAYGAATTTSGSSSSAAGVASGEATPSAPSSSATGPPLWVGGTATSPSAGPYNLAITGSIYYTTTPSALDACTKATAAVKQG